MTDLFQHSIRVILDHQAASGAYIASPNFFQYRYCWFRDGSYIAYSMDMVGHGESSARFHAWAADAVNARAELVQRTIEIARSGHPLEERDILHTRYTLDGGDGVQEEWPNFQLDGFGTWLWALGEHQRLSAAPLPDAWIRAATLVADYLEALWRTPCFDCWEEFPQDVHGYTLGAIYGGLAAHSRISGADHTRSLNAIWDFLMEKVTRADHFTKAAGWETVDASLMALATPYRVVDPGDPRMTATVAAIERDLRRDGGGVHRYAADTYYGGGEWVLLAAWLGWYYAEAGETDKSRELLEWVEGQGNTAGDLPEQVPMSLNAPEYYPQWFERWGEIARPLLWSHAKYLILKVALDRATRSSLASNGPNKQ